jgi:hypothetical protein
MDKVGAWCRGGRDRACDARRLAMAGREVIVLEAAEESAP